MTSDYDATRPPEPSRKRRRGKRIGALVQAAPWPCRWQRRDVHGSRRGGREALRRRLLRPPGWSSHHHGGDEIALYLFLGGVAGGSGCVPAAGAQLTGRDALRRNTRLGGLAAVGVGAVALVADLGRPDRFYNMLRTFKVTSPMSVGSWILSALLRRTLGGRGRRHRPPHR